MKILLISLLALFTLGTANMPAEVNNKDVTGVWKTIDDESGKAKSHVQIYKKSGKLYGKIIKLYREPGEEADPVCNDCPGNRKGKKIIGMEIITGLEYRADDKEWYADDAILDPNNGKVYDCKIYLDSDNPDELKVRGYIGWVYRTQTWHRVR